MFIDKNTVCTIEKINEKTYRLTFYNDCNPVFQKDYKSFKAANIARGKLFYKFCH